MKLNKQKDIKKKRIYAHDPMRTNEAATRLMEISWKFQR